MILPWAIAIAVSMSLAGPVVAADKDSKPLLENERVRVTRVDLAKDASVPDDNRYDVATIQLEVGDVRLQEPGQLQKPEPVGAGQVHYFVARSKRSLKNVGRQPVAFTQVQFMRSPGKYVAFEVPPTHYCDPGVPKACVTEQYLFCTDRFCAESVELDPGASSTHHTHADDYIVFATSDFTWRNEVDGRPPQQEKFKTGDVLYVQKGSKHRLVNDGKTTAHLIMIQFK